MPIRRAHTKSRHGCLQCKQARTKCDEQKPNCTRCLKKEQPCSLSDSHSTLIVIHDSQSASTWEEQNKAATDTSVSATPEEKPPGVATISLKDGVQDEVAVHPAPVSAPSEPSFTQAEFTRLALMNHYSSVVCETIARLTHGDEKGISIWRHKVSQLAFEHEFLLHGLLGISALHLAISNPSLKKSHVPLATHHLDIGLALFRPHLSNLTADNVDALFAFACITALHSFGFHRVDLSQLSPLARIHEGLTLVRGTSVIVKGGIQWLVNGPWGFGDLLQVLESAPELPKTLEDVCSKLSERVGTTITTSTQSHVYVEAIKVLKMSLSLAMNRPHTQITMISFPIVVQPEFFEMVCIGEPLALAVLANYAVILHWMGNCIWLNGWGKITVDAIRQAIPPDWHSCIAWAVQEVDRDPRLP